MKLSPAVRILLLLTLTAVAACRSGLLDGGSRADTDACDAGPCTLQDDGGNEGAVTEDPLAKDPVWGCLGHVPPPAEADPNVPIQYSRRFTSIISTKPLVGLAVKACREDDPECAQPVEGTPTLTDASGLVALPLHRGFRGFLDVAPQGDFASLVPAVIHVVPIPDKDVPATDRTVAWSGLLTKSELEFMVASVGKQVVPEYGHLFFRALDCSLKAVADVVATVGPMSAQTFTFYSDNTGVPSITQSITAANGQGGFINLPVGTAKVTFRREDGTLIGQQDVIVRAGTITYVSLVPTP